MSSSSVQFGLCDVNEVLRARTGTSKNKDVPRGDGRAMDPLLTIKVEHRSGTEAA